MSNNRDFFVELEELKTLHKVTLKLVAHLLGYDYGHHTQTLKGDLLLAFLPCHASIGVISTALVRQRLFKYTAVDTASAQ